MSSNNIGYLKDWQECSYIGSAFSNLSWLFAYLIAIFQTNIKYPLFLMVLFLNPESRNTQDTYMSKCCFKVTFYRPWWVSHAYHSSNSTKTWNKASMHKDPMPTLLLYLRSLDKGSSQAIIADSPFIIKFQTYNIYFSRVGWWAVNFWISRHDIITNLRLSGMSSCMERSFSNTCLA